MDYDQDNIFARILRGEIPCKKVYEDDFALAFHDINPKARVHVLVIPKLPCVTMSDFTKVATAEQLAGFLKAVAKVAEQLGLEANGYRLLANIGTDGGQEVQHLHFHIVGGHRLGPMLVRQT
jgi:diadenosine tetraphosphate (Ap4A) HIT family hydrolase